jgi:hypothetical protein
MITFLFAMFIYTQTATAATTMRTKNIEKLMNEFNKLCIHVELERLSGVDR